MSYAYHLYLNNGQQPMNTNRIIITESTRLNTPLIQALKEVVPPQRVHDTVEDLAVFGYDGTWSLHRPDAVVSPLTAAEVSAVVKVAKAQGVAVVPRGGGTGLAGGSVPVEGGIVVSTTMMNRILELD